MSTSSTRPIGITSAGTPTLRATRSTTGPSTTPRAARASWRSRASSPRCRLRNAPERSILFLSVTGEEQGLLGSEYYAQHPLYPLAKTLADINIDVLQPSGKSRDLEVIGYGNSTIDDIARELLAKEGRIVVPDLQPEKGGFYRSDHFEFAKVGVPAFYAGGGEDIIGQPEGYGRMRRDEYVAKDYHKVTDEIKPWWDLRGAAQDADLLFLIGQNLAKTEVWPTWKPGCEFKSRRDAMMAAAAH